MARLFSPRSRSQRSGEASGPSPSKQKRERCPLARSLGLTNRSLRVAATAPVILGIRSPISLSDVHT